MARFKILITAAMQLFLVLSFVPSTQAFFRHLCFGEVGTGRIDPIVSPNKVSQHIHGIHGAQNMALDVTTDMLLDSNCTSCAIAEDKSVYWSPYLYFQHENGTYQMVPKSGGLTAYYFTERPADIPDATIVAFPAGFRMIAGNNFRRSKWDTVADQVPPPYRTTAWTDYDAEQQMRAGNMIGFNCLHYNRGFDEDSLGRHFMPDKDFIDKNCPDGIRAELMFPTCWNGQLDSENHQDHVAYPRDARNGPCPQGFDQRFPALFFETIYVTGLFKAYKGQFVFANGDPTGYGYHGDFISGWEGTVLQQAIDNWQCTNPHSLGNQQDCPVFHIKEPQDFVNCKMETPEALQNEKIDLVNELPGGIKIDAGPGWAAPVAGVPADAPPAISGSPATFTAATPTPPIVSTPSPVPTTSFTNSSMTPAQFPGTGTGTPVGHGSLTSAVPKYSSNSNASFTASSVSNVSATMSTSAPSYDPQTSAPGVPLFSNTSIMSTVPRPVMASATSAPVTNAGFETITSMSTDAAGRVVEWVIVQEVQTTTVYVDQAGQMTRPTGPVTTYPLQPVKKHRHARNHVRGRLLWNND